MTDDLACIDQIELMTDYLEGALSAEQARRLEHHLATCPGCTEYLAQLRAVAGSLEGLGGETISAETRAALIAAFRDPRNA
jgi:anti-sigma factor RsiW